MNLSHLKPADGATKSRKRIGRGEGSGHGGTATRGHKGQKSRSGSKRRPAWFEGGQMPLQRRLPKYGFKNRFRVEYQPVNVARLADLVEKGTLSADNAITPEVLVAAGAAKPKDRIKILGSGELTVALNLTVHACSASARAKIEAAGGSVEVIGRTNS